jgi:hypothetical protein
MKIRFDPSALRQTRWYEYAARFLFGGAISAIAAMISKKFGPQIGGLFLAFPAIFPSSATLIEKHQREKKERKGLHGTIRGRLAAGVDAAGQQRDASGSWYLPCSCRIFCQLTRAGRCWVERQVRG